MLVRELLSVPAVKLQINLHVLIIIYQIMMELVPNANGVAIAITAAQHVELLITSVQRDIALTMENASQIMTVNDGGGS